ncbi:hypothetical protein BO70DRAFT_358503, partial [Aspergillus heteromorphus CBS 117.55]
MSPDAPGAVGHAALPPFPSSSSSSLSSFSSPRRRRKTESAVNQPIHVLLDDSPSISLCRRSIVNRARTVTFSSGANNQYQHQHQHQHQQYQQQPGVSSPTLTDSFASPQRPGPNAAAGHPPSR